MIKRKKASASVNKAGIPHTRESENSALPRNRARFFSSSPGKIMIAAVPVLCLLLGAMYIFFSSLQGKNAENTGVNAVMHTGTISDSGEMIGHPLMFYLSGKEISSVRFSCKNQWISFMDWTEERDDAGLAQNFTVPYGGDPNEYHNLLIDWVPNATIRTLADNAGETISGLPNNLREDLIVMEITFTSGETATKAISVSLQDDGAFSAVLDDYTIGSGDDFVRRRDSTALRAGIQNTSSAQEEIHSSSETSGMEEARQAAEKAARVYYTGTVFEVLEIQCMEQTDTKAVFSVQVSRDGIIQDPIRTITLQLDHGSWTVVNEGY